MNGLAGQLIVCAAGFGIPALIARLCPPPSKTEADHVLVTRFRRCRQCASTQACAIHRDGSYTCLTCMTTHPIERQR